MKPKPVFPTKRSCVPVAHGAAMGGYVLERRFDAESALLPPPSTLAAVPNSPRHALTASCGGSRSPSRTPPAWALSP